MLELINFTYSEAEEQNNLFTPLHTLFDCTIEYNGNKYDFNYQCNTTHCEPSLVDCLDCLFLDASAYDDSKDIYEFAEAFGYDIEDEETERAYNDCKKTSEALDYMFTNEEYSKIQDEICEAM